VGLRVLHFLAGVAAQTCPQLETGTARRAADIYADSVTQTGMYSLKTGRGRARCDYYGMAVVSTHYSGDEKGTRFRVHLEVTDAGPPRSHILHSESQQNRLSDYILWMRPRKILREKIKE
jgi:hypothetical protein